MGGRTTWRRWGALVFAAVLAAGPAPASENRTPFLSLERYGLDQGLSQLSVTSMVEDDAGFLWIGTQEGLNRFDGQRFVAHRRHSGAIGTGLSSSSIDALAFESTHSRLWIGTNDAGLDVMDLRTGGHRRIGADQGLTEAAVARVMPDAEGGAWLGTDRGLFHVDPGVTRARRLGGTAAVVGLQATDDGAAFALDAACGLWRLGPTRRERIALEMTPEAACVALQADGDSLWLASASGDVLRVSVAGRLLRHLPPTAPRGAAAELTAMRLRAGGELLLGHGDGSLLRLDPEGEQPPQWLDFDQPPESAIQSIYESRSGVLWLGSHTRGLFRARPLSAAVRRERMADSDIAAWPARSVRSFWRADGVDLVGTDLGLAVRTDADRSWRTLPAIGATSVRAIVPDGEGGWWVGTHRGLWRLDAGLSATPVPGLPDARVTDLLVDGDELWVATRGGLARFRNGLPVADGVPATLSGVFLTSLMRDDLGRLWIGSNERGLFRLGAGGALENLSPDNGRLPHNSVWSLYADSRSFWVGTFSGGLLRLDREDGGIHAYTMRDGLANDVIYRILPDSLGRLWLSTNNGLSVLDPYEGGVQSLGRGDGLRNREYNSGAGFVDPQGLLYFGGTEGLDSIDAEALELSSASATPLLAGLEVVGQRGGRALPRPGRRFDTLYADRVELAPDDAVLALDLVAVDFTAPDAARLRYRLAGVHDDWVQARGPQADLMLSYLAPGDYLLEISAAGRDGRFGPSRRVLISMPPPPWRHPLAYAGYALLAMAGIGWLARRARGRVQEREARIALLDRIVAERTAELEAANQKLQLSNRELDHATRTDPLTRVSNRRDIQQWLAREGRQILDSSAASASGHGGLVFFMIDIDDFKRINDNHGHHAGDEVLVSFAARLGHLSRGQDVVVRWGGEEFLWILRDLPVRDAAAVAERARRAICDTPFLLSSGLHLAVTCSIGFAPWPFSPACPAIGDWEQSVELADRALYAAKAGGKNAWVGLLPGPAADRTTVQALLAGAAPERLADGAVQVPHSTPEPPDFEPR